MWPDFSPFGHRRGWCWTLSCRKPPDDEPFWLVFGQRPPYDGPFWLFLEKVGAEIVCLMLSWDERLHCCHGYTTCLNDCMSCTLVLVVCLSCVTMAILDLYTHTISAPTSLTIYRALFYPHSSTSSHVATNPCGFGHVLAQCCYHILVALDIF